MLNPRPSERLHREDDHHDERDHRGGATDQTFHPTPPGASCVRRTVDRDPVQRRRRHRRQRIPTGCRRGDGVGEPLGDATASQARPWSRQRRAEKGRTGDLDVASERAALGGPIAWILGQAADHQLASEQRDRLAGQCTLRVLHPESAEVGAEIRRIDR